MPRTIRERTLPRPTAIVASAAVLSDMGITDLVKHSRSARGWQDQAWKFYDTIGEYRYACDWVGAMLSRAVLTVVDSTPDGPKQITSGEEVEVLDSLYGGREGHAEMLRLIGVHFTVAGECYLFGWVDDAGEHWKVAAANKVSYRGGKNKTITWYLNGEKISDGEVYAARLWMPHPERELEANSPSRAVLGILGEIEMLTQHVAAQAQSRLLGAGIYWVPSEMTLPAPIQGLTDPDAVTPNAGTAPNTATSLMSLMMRMMSTAIKDRSSAAAHVPIVISAPADQIDAAKFQTFWTELDAHAIELRREAVGRLALGLDMPPEILTGNTGDNHWNAWLADESAIKAHTEPLLRVITYSLTHGYLLPAIGETDKNLAIRADTSQMRLRPNRSKEAIELYDRGELTGAALRRETGFSPDDELDPPALADWLAKKVAQGQTTPEIVAAALKALGVPVDLTILPDVSHESRPTPSLLEHPTRNPPEMEASLWGELVSACDQMALRALERAGNRLRSRAQVKPPGVTASMTHLVMDVRQGDLDFLLDDAWTNVPDVAHRIGVDEQRLTNALDSYCRIRLQSKAPHSYTTLREYLLFTLGQQS